MAFCHRWRDCDKAACPKITSVRSKATSHIPFLPQLPHPHALTCIFFVHYSRGRTAHGQVATDATRTSSWGNFFPSNKEYSLLYIFPLRVGDIPGFPFILRAILF